MVPLLRQSGHPNDDGGQNCDTKHHLSHSSQQGITHRALFNVSFAKLFSPRFVKISYIPIPCDLYARLSCLERVGGKAIIARIHALHNLA